MKLGVTFPHQTIGSDPAAIREFIQTLEGEGFDFLSGGEHVLGAHSDRNPDRPTFTHDMPFHEPFTLFSYAAALTERIEFITAVLILPQRQTALVAKQAAELSLLSNDRFLMGIGVGWNIPEFETLGVPFENRGSRAEEQFAVMRRLWSEELVSFDGRWHHLDRVAITPRPARNIPILIGCAAEERLLRRVARTADGWIPQGDISESLPRLQAMLDEVGRNTASFSVVSGLTAGPEGAQAWIAEAKRLQALGVTHCGVRVPAAPGATPMEVLRSAAAARKVIAEGT